MRNKIVSLNLEKSESLVRRLEMTETVIAIIKLRRWPACVL